MGVTVIVDKITVSHRGSNGTSISFPDPCKTPTPGGPVPLPYPNIAKSSDIANGSTTVTMDGQPIMLKRSNMMISTGDEAGSALGVVSNMIKGKAEFVNYSFDVKVDGDNVCRLTDPAQQNMGSGNAFGPAHVQPPLIVDIIQLKGCAETNEKKRKQEEKQKNNPNAEGTGWNESGVWEGHRDAFQKVADNYQVIFFIRQTNKWCADAGWIPGNHQPKPHDIIKAKTIEPENDKIAENWLLNYWEDIAKVDDMKGILGKAVSIVERKLEKPEYPSSLDVDSLWGVVMSYEKGGKYGMPLRAQKTKRDINGKKYKGKWITGDYDLQDIVVEPHDFDLCQRPSGIMFGIYQTELNKEMGWKGIQHGPQAEWVAVEGEYDEHGILHEGESFDMKTRITMWLKENGTEQKKVRITPADAPQVRRLRIVDEKITIVSPGRGPIFMETPDDTKNALKCCGCHRIKISKEQEEKEKDLIKAEDEKSKEK